MKRCLLLATVVTTLASLTSCGTVGRTINSVARTFTGVGGQSVPVIR